MDIVLAESLSLADTGSVLVSESHLSQNTHFFEEN